MPTISIDGNTFTTIEEFIEYLQETYGANWEAQEQSLLQWGKTLDANVSTGTGLLYRDGVRDFGSIGQVYIDKGWMNTDYMINYDSYYGVMKQYGTATHAEIAKDLLLQEATYGSDTYYVNSLPLGKTTPTSAPANTFPTLSQTATSANGQTQTATCVMTEEKIPDPTVPGSFSYIGTLAALGWLPLPTWVAAAAPLLGVGLGFAINDLAPDFWEAVSRALLPFAYKDDDNVNIPITFTSDGNVYTSEEALEALRQALISQGVFNTSYEPNPDTYPSGTVISLTPVSFLNAVQLVVEDVNSLINNGRLSSMATYLEVTPEQVKTMFSVLLNAVIQHPELYANIPVNFIGVSAINFRFGYAPSNTATVEGVDSTTGVNKISSITGGYYRSTIEGYVSQVVQISMGSYGGSGALYNVTIQDTNYSTWIVVGAGNGKGIQITLPKINSVITTPDELPVSNSYTSKIFGLYEYPFVLNLVGGSGVEGTTIEEGATYPTDTTQNLAEIYPQWAGNGISVITDPSADTFEDGTKQWYPISLSNTNYSGNPEVTSSTQNQQQAQTGSNTDPSQLTQILEAIQNLPDILNRDGLIPDTVPTNPPTTEPTPSPTPPVITGAGSDLISIYNPTKAQIQAFNQFLWDLDPTNLVNWQKVIQNPIDAIISLHMIYVTPITGSPQHIKCGYIETDVSSKIVTNQYVDIDCGTVNVSEYFHNVWDYIATDIQIYLPFIGIIPLHVSDIMNSTMRVKYRVDVYTGTCLAQIIVYKENSFAVLYTYTGNCAVSLPLSGGSFSNIMSTLIVMCGLVMSGNVGTAATYAVGRASRGELMQHIQRSGNIGANAGAMGIRTPYLIITRKKPLDAYLYQEQYGFPANKTVVLGDMRGYTRVKNIHLHGIPCTDDELEMIERLLKDGVIIN